MIAHVERLEIPVAFYRPGLGQNLPFHILKDEGRFGVDNRSEIDPIRPAREETAVASPMETLRCAAQSNRKTKP
jgi:hypothetical protein